MGSLKEEMILLPQFKFMKHFNLLFTLLHFQFPIVELVFPLTVHKSQRQMFDKIMVAFSYEQLYISLFKVKS